MTWPNRITYFRILLVPAFAVAALQVREHPFFRYLAAAILVAIALGDLLDGFIARRWHMTTLEGKFIDPLADKLLMTTACVFLALPLWGPPGGEPPLEPTIAIIIVARDVLISLWVASAMLAGARTVFEPSRLGKATTFVQMAMLVMMVVGTISPAVLAYVARPLSYLAVALTIGSGIQYFYAHTRGFAFQRKGPQGQ